MRQVILVLSILMFATPLLAEEAKAPEVKAAPAKVLKVAQPATEAAPAAAVEAKPVEAATAPVSDVKPAEAAPAADAKPVLKVVEKADPIPDDPEEVILLIEQLVKAAQAGQWQLFVGLLLTLIVWILRKFNIIKFMPDKAIPWFAAGIGMLGYLGVSLASGLALLPAILQGLLVGAAAVGLWEMIGQHFLKPKKA